MRARSPYLVLFLVLYFHFSSAQEMTSIRFDHLTVDDGLSQNSVRCLLQDSKGFMWFGTEEGLNRYDGYSFQVLQNRAGDTTSLSTNDVRSIIEDRDGNIWVGTTDGLNILDRNTNAFSRVHLPVAAGHSARRNFIFSLFEDQDRDIWIGTRDGFYLFRHQENRFEFFDHLLSRRLPQVMSFFQDSEGKIWLGAQQGILFQLDKDKGVINDYSHELDELDLPDVSCILQDQDGVLWVGTYSGLLKGIPVKHRQSGAISYRFETVSPSLKNFVSKLNMIRCMAEDDKGLIWIGTFEGLLVLDPQKETFVGLQNQDDLPTGLSANFIRCIGKDNRGDIWLGTIQGGINVYHHSNFGFEHNLSDWRIRMEMNGKIIQGFSEDAEGNLWVATRDGGVSLIDRKLESVTNFAHDSKNKNSLSINEVRSVMVDRNGRVWMGTYFGGLNRFDPESGKFKLYLPDPEDKTSINNDMINAILEDRSGAVWVATHYGGLNLYDRETDSFIHFTHENDNPNSLSGDIIISLYEDSNQNLWIGTRHSGLNRMNLRTREITRFHYTEGKPGSISSNAITVVAQDSRGVIWVGTEDAGLNRFDVETERFENFRKTDGLPSDAVHGVLEDDDGLLWLSTNKGLCHFDPEGPSYTNYNQKDGLNTNQFMRNAYLKTKRGELLFGSVNGVTRFQPNQIEDNDFEPPVYITGFRLFNEEPPIGQKGSPLTRHISETASITLKNKQSVFSFDYVALNYVRSAKNQYAYRLEGLDPEGKWNEVGDKRSVDYTTLPPGDYVFRVKASNNSGVWNEKGAAINLTILPPWYKTGWAYGIYAIAFALLLWAYRSYTLQRIKEKHQLKLARIEKEKVEEVNKIKMKFFTDISHELRTPLTLILGPLDKLSEMTKGHSKANRYLSTIRTNAKYLLRLINELLEFRKMEMNKMQLHLQKADIGILANIVRKAFLEKARQNQVDFYLIDDLEESKGLFDVDKIQKILYNLLANAFKFTTKDGGGKVSLHLSSFQKENRKFIRIEVTDNGIGVPPEELEHIFNPFYQGKHKSDGTGGGTGIGLALTQRLIELHGGRIRVQSQLYFGTTFTVDLPLNQDKKPEKQTLWPTGEPLRRPYEEAIEMEAIEASKSASLDTGPGENKPLVLFAEDNAQMRNYLMDCLEEDWRVIGVADGRQGWEKALALQPDLIVTDVMMPKVDGVEFCQKLKSDIRTSHIPVVFLTARTSLEHRIDGLETGADAYLSKPFSCKHLNAVIKNILMNRRKLWESFKCGNKLFVKNEKMLGPLDQRFLDKLVKVVEINLKNSEFTVEEFVREMAMSRSYFHRKLKALTGLSASEFIKDRRLQKAARLLLENKCTISEIAYEAGFSSPNYFGRCFRKKYGMNPTEYKERNLLV